jgi:hypothetical protein
MTERFTAKGTKLKREGREGELTDGREGAYHSARKRGQASRR